MKFTLATAIAVAASAVSAISPRAVTDTEMGWGKALAGDSKACADLGVIFARGTFDPGNIGPWVGAPFRDALAAKTKSVSFQGVDPGAYPADLAGYVVEGGSEKCALSMGVVIDAYVKACPKAKIAVTGWSQGSLCARKSFGVMSPASAAKVIAYVSFGDPYPVWASGKNMIVQLPLQASKQLSTLASDIKNGHLQRWMLSPQHFWYGLDGSTTKAAEQVVAALNGSKKK
ncbi:unnamed protein product [Clonostachys rosea f. rosea IK726]|uniref:Uncharacterized protein n=1 Tax=Clonostachys rosea f. rosea IK726 TaxID=1349383 RepID=A0ACA9U2W5_BIOOC|nr:unnamed protein product [Clonostachys rosea f. rosea IK726]